MGGSTATMKREAKRGHWLRGWSRLAVVASLALTLVGCGNQTTSSSQTIVIGVGGPMTGDAAANGKQIMQGAQLAVDLINSSGGIAGGPKKGAKLSLKQF